MSDSVQNRMSRSDPYSTIDTTNNAKPNFFHLSPVKKELFNNTAILAVDPKTDFTNFQRNYNEQFSEAPTHSPPSQLPETK